MSDNVVEFPGVTTLDIPPETILKSALKADLEMVVVLGWTEDETLYAASSSGSSPEAVFLVEHFKHALLSGEIG